jgi:hypothetical protein
MVSQWRSLGTLLILLLVSIGVFAAAFAVRMTLLPDVLPIASAEPTQSLWALEATFVLRAVENITALSAVLVLAAAVARWVERQTKVARRLDLHQS